MCGCIQMLAQWTRGPQLSRPSGIIRATSRSRWLLKRVPHWFSGVSGVAMFMGWEFLPSWQS